MGSLQVTPSRIIGNGQTPLSSESDEEKLRKKTNLQNTAAGKVYLEIQGHTCLFHSRILQRGGILS
jgi:hypothetical protein